METSVKETLKINDELSIELDVLYENGEKYVHVSDYGLRYGYPVVTCIYMDALSDHINQEPYLLSDDDPDVSLWDIWMKNEYKKYSTQPLYVYEGQENQMRLYSDLYRYDGMGHRLEHVFSDNVLFPLIIKDTFVHFDVFLFLLYLKYPQYKNDIMRFLKYQPVCTMTSDQLFIHNLKQTNKDLLKQLNESNHKLSPLEKEHDTLIKERDELKQKLAEQNEELSNSKNREIELSHTNNELTKERDELKEKLSSSEESLQLTSEELTTANQRVLALEEERDSMRLKAKELEDELSKLKSALKMLM